MIKKSIEIVYEHKEHVKKLSLPYNNLRIQNICTHKDMCVYAGTHTCVRINGEEFRSGSLQLVEDLCV